tara:strand:- start:3004 stop:4143 length:1140 start_codon:yes stop_codon:yes gene_type:complete
MNKEKRIFCFIQLYHISECGGGAEVQVNYLSQELAKKGFEVHYVCKSIHYNSKKSVVILNGVKIHWLPNKQNINRDNLNLIYDKLLEIKPAFIIERMSSAYGKSILRYKKINKNVKYVWICTDNLSPLKFKNVYSSFKNLSLIKFLYVLYKNYKTDIIRQKVIKNADYVFYQNTIQNSLIYNNFNREASLMVSGHPNTSKVSTAKERFKKQTILWCANLGTHKRPELFIELATKMQHTNFNFVMVGGHSDQNYVNKLLANKPKNLTISGKLSFEEALKYFDEATILINSSISEGFSNTYIQAWLRGVPTLVFGADPDNIIEKNNLGYNVATIAETIQQIETVFNNYNSYEMLSNNVYSYALENHSIKKMTDNFLKALYL